MTAPDLGLKMRKTIAEYQGDGWWMTMDEEGDVAEHSSAERVVRAVRRRDAASARRGVSTVTLIEWRDVPDGFVVPDLDTPRSETP